ncbi:hypothetical protein [Peribacillus sp. SCS-155]|uniref:hypothetical protein n=1 Tax=Peribacillus sedimenti TaxID=3115297 RepID=UPI0039068173
MPMCPLCNAFKEMDMNCQNCGAKLNDAGKVSDFLDPYGHYNDDATVKMGDGYANTSRGGICPHLMACNDCGHDQVIFINEE